MQTYILAIIQNLKKSSASGRVTIAAVVKGAGLAQSETHTALLALQASGKVVLMRLDSKPTAGDVAAQIDLGDGCTRHLVYTA